MTNKNNKSNGSNAAIDTLKTAANEKLDAAKNKFDHVIVIGMKNDTSAIDLSSTINQYPFLHWMLNKTVFELNVLEKQNAAVAEVENTVGETLNGTE